MKITVADNQIWFSDKINWYLERVTGKKKCHSAEETLNDENIINNILLILLIFL